MNLILNSLALLLPVTLILIGSVICRRKNSSPMTAVLLIGSILWIAGLSAYLVAEESLFRADAMHFAAAQNEEYSAPSGLITLLEVGGITEVVGSIVFAIAFVSLQANKPVKQRNSSSGSQKRNSGLPPYER